MLMYLEKYLCMFAFTYMVSSETFFHDLATYDYDKLIKLKFVLLT
jgi:hypothetical protein